MPNNSQVSTAGKSPSGGAGKGFSMVVTGGINSGGLKEANKK